MRSSLFSTSRILHDLARVVLESYSIIRAYLFQRSKLRLYLPDMNLNAWSIYALKQYIHKPQILDFTESNQLSGTIIYILALSFSCSGIGPIYPPLSYVIQLPALWSPKAMTFPHNPCASWLRCPEPAHSLASLRVRDTDDINLVVLRIRAIGVPLVQAIANNNSIHCQ